MYTQNLPELLAPAGDVECLKAAIWAGADAVYFGCPKYNARAFAENFTDEKLKEAFFLCRLYGVKAYLTFNTLINEKEFEEVFSYILSICKEYKPDAVIIQDLGLAKRLYEAIGIPIVASTQMALHNAYGAKLLKKIGVFRIVAAREMSLESVKIMQEESGLETELFVHGAICVSQSGGCLMSSMIGKRSGNQGQCAQPCRLPYANSYPLSLKDMCLAGHIKEIIDAGISSLKIEGRMKDPSYVYSVTSVYRRLLDQRRNATKEELSFLSKVFSRSGFTDAFFTKKISIDMFGIRTKEDKINSSSVKLEPKKQSMPISISAYLDENISRAVFSYKDISVEVCGEKPQIAQNKPLSTDEVTARLSKTGNSFFQAEEAKAEICGKLFMSASALNELRRAAISMLEKEIVEKNTPRYKKAEAQNEKPLESAPKKELSVRITTFNDITPDVFSEYEQYFDFFDIPLWREKMLFDFAKAYGCKTRAIMPRCIYPEDEEAIKELLKKAKEIGVNAVLCSGFSQKKIAQGMDIYADFTANIQNKESLKIYRDEGFSGVCLSPELKKGGVNALCDIMPVSLCVYGKLPLMHSRACLVESTRGKRCNRSTKEVCTVQLNDRIGANFKICREYGHRSMLYNSVPVWLFDKQIPENCGEYLIFTDESENRIKEILNKFKRKEVPDVNSTRGYY